MNVRPFPDEMLVTLTSDIVIAHVSHNAIATAQVAKLIELVYGALAALRSSDVTEPVQEEIKPVVSVRASVRPDAVTCMTCGTELKVLKRHLASYHGMTVEQYRRKWGLSPNHPVVAPSYAERRRAIAKDMGLGLQFGMNGRKKAEVSLLSGKGRKAAAAS